MVKIGPSAGLHSLKFHYDYGTQKGRSKHQIDSSVIQMIMHYVCEHVGKKEGAKSSVAIERVKLMKVSVTCIFGFSTYLGRNMTFLI